MIRYCFYLIDFHISIRYVVFIYALKYVHLQEKFFVVFIACRNIRFTDSVNKLFYVNLAVSWPNYAAIQEAHHLSMGLEFGLLCPGAWLLG